MLAAVRRALVRGAGAERTAAAAATALRATAAARRTRVVHGRALSTDGKRRGDDDVSDGEDDTPAPALTIRMPGQRPQHQPQHQPRGAAPSDRSDMFVKRTGGSGSGGERQRGGGRDGDMFDRPRGERGGGRGGRGGYGGSGSGSRARVEDHDAVFRFAQKQLHGLSVKQAMARMRLWLSGTEGYGATNMGWTKHLRPYWRALFHSPTIAPALQSSDINNLLQLITRNCRGDLVRAFFQDLDSPNTGFPLRDAPAAAAGAASGAAGAGAGAAASASGSGGVNAPRKLPVDERTFMIALHGLTKKGGPTSDASVEWMNDIWSGMIAVGVPPQSGAFTALLYTHARRGSLRDLYFWYQLMYARRRVGSESSIFTAVMHGLLFDPAVPPRLKAQLDAWPQHLRPRPFSPALTASGEPADQPYPEPSHFAGVADELSRRRYRPKRGGSGGNGRDSSGAAGDVLDGLPPPPKSLLELQRQEDERQARGLSAGFSTVVFAPERNAIDVAIEVADAIVRRDYRAIVRAFPMAQFDIATAVAPHPRAAEAAKMRELLAAQPAAGLKAAGASHVTKLPRVHDDDAPAPAWPGAGATASAAHASGVAQLHRAVRNAAAAASGSSASSAGGADDAASSGSGSGSGKANGNGNGSGSGNGLAHGPSLMKTVQLEDTVVFEVITHLMEPHGGSAKDAVATYLWRMMKDRALAAEPPISPAAAHGAPSALQRLVDAADGVAPVRVRPEWIALTADRALYRSLSFTPLLTARDPSFVCALYVNRVFDSRFYAREWNLLLLGLVRRREYTLFVHFYEEMRERDRAKAPKRDEFNAMRMADEVKAAEAGTGAVDSDGPIRAAEEVDDSVDGPVTDGGVLIRDPDTGKALDPQERVPVDAELSGAAAYATMKRAPHRQGNGRVPMPPSLRATLPLPFLLNAVCHALLTPAAAAGDALADVPPLRRAVGSANMGPRQPHHSSQQSQGKQQRQAHEEQLQQVLRERGDAVAYSASFPPPALAASAKRVRDEHGLPYAGANLSLAGPAKLSDAAVLALDGLVADMKAALVAAAAAAADPKSA